MYQDESPIIDQSKAERLLADAFVVAQTQGKSAYNDVIKAFYRDRRVAKIIHDRARVMRCLDDKEEIQQQVAILLSEKLLDDLCSRPNPPTAIYTVLSTTTHFVCQTLMKQNLRASERQVSLHPDDNLDQHFETLGITSPDADLSEEILDRVDQESAQIEFARRKALLMSKQNENPNRKAHFLDRPGLGQQIPKPPKTAYIAGVGQAVKVKHAGPRRKFDPDGQAKLVKIQKELGLTNQQLAHDLGIQLATLSSYIYGRVVAGVPIVHIQAAQALLANSQATIRKREALSGKTQSEIISEWERQLGIHGRGDVDALLAEIFEVNQVTVWRWKKPDGTVLSPATLSDYNDLVKRKVNEGWAPKGKVSVHNLPFPEIMDHWYSLLGIARHRNRLQIVANAIGINPWELSDLLASTAERPAFRRLDEWFRRIQKAAAERVQLQPLINPDGLTGVELVAAFEQALEELSGSSKTTTKLRSVLGITGPKLKALGSSDEVPDIELARSYAALFNDHIRATQR